MKCTYCSCTEEKACVVVVATQPARIRERIEAMYARAGAAVPRTLGCSWFNYDPPVCSAAKCVAKFEKARKA